MRGLAANCQDVPGEAENRHQLSRITPPVGERHGIKHHDRARENEAPWHPVGWRHLLSALRYLDTLWALQPIVSDLDGLGPFPTQCRTINQQTLHTNNEEHDSKCEEEGAPHGFVSAKAFEVITLKTRPR